MQTKDENVTKKATATQHVPQAVKDAVFVSSKSLPDNTPIVAGKIIIQFVRTVNINELCSQISALFVCIILFTYYVIERVNSMFVIFFTHFPSLFLVCIQATSGIMVSITVNFLNHSIDADCKPQILR